MRFEAGIKIGDWTLVSDVDAGLIAPLWVANDSKQHLAYARNYRVRSPKISQRLEQVAGWAKSFDHNAILPMRERHEIRDGLAVLSHYEEGQPLASIMTRARLARKPIPFAVAVSLALDILEGLDAMGGKLAPVWTHGGVRPEAVLVTRGGRARLMEVGLSGVVATSEPLSTNPKWAAYAAPEQLTPGRVAGPTDVFTVAALLWEMLVGRPLFAGKDAAGLRQQILEGAIERADVAAKDAVPKALSLVLEQALDRDPDDRYETAQAFGAAVRSAAGDLAEPYDVSQYLEQVQLVALDTRRRVLGDALGRPAPQSMPPPPKQKGAEPVRFATPKVPVFDRPPTIARPRAAAKPAGAKPAPKPAPAAPVAPPEAPRDTQATDAGFEEPLVASRPPEAEAPNVEPPPPEESQPAVSEDVVVSPAPPSSTDVAIDDEEPVEEHPDGRTEQMPPVESESAEDESPDASDSWPVRPSAAAVAVAAATAKVEAAAKTEEPAPAPAARAASPVPPEPRSDVPSVYDMRPRRRLPWFVLGVLVGGGAVFGVAYKAPHLLRLPAPKPSQSVPAPSVTPSAAEEPPPEPTETAPEPSATTSASSKVRPRPPRRGGRPVKPAPEVPAPGPAPAPAPAPVPKDPY